MLGTALRVSITGRTSVHVYLESRAITHAVLRLRSRNGCRTRPFGRDGVTCNVDIAYEKSPRAPPPDRAREREGREGRPATPPVSRAASACHSDGAMTLRACTYPPSHDEELVLCRVPCADGTIQSATPSHGTHLFLVTNSGVGRVANRAACAPPPTLPPPLISARHCRRRILSPPALALAAASRPAPLPCPPGPSRALQATARSLIFFHPPIFGPFVWGTFLGGGYILGL
jgi:hypothetical protein